MDYGGIVKQFDIIIIGAGVSGLFTAMGLANQNKKVLIIDAGKSLAARLSRLGDDIAGNQSSDRYMGFGGLGLSEGKYNYTNDFGGDLASKIGPSESLYYQHKVDQLLCSYGATARAMYRTDDIDLMKRAKQFGFNILSTQTRHLGTSLSVNIFSQFAKYLSEKMSFYFDTTVDSITPYQQQLKLTLNNNCSVLANKVIVAVGRGGMAWFDPIAKQLKLDYQQTRLDLGFRIEMHGQQLAPLLKNTFETKLDYSTNDYRATTYCMNPKGRVIAKHQDGLVMADGQNAHEVGQSHNLNFTLFIPKWFTTRDAADNYLYETISTINQHQSNIAVQRLADIDSHFQYCQQTIEPTLTSANYSDLAVVTPNEYLYYTCDFLKALEKLLGEPIDGNTLLYALDSKLYAPVIKTDHRFLTQVNNLYIIGDCSGVTSSLSQAAASGLYVADQLCHR